MFENHEQAREEPPALDPAARRRQIVHLVTIDVLVLAELAIAVYGANALRDRWDFTLVFCVIFFGLVIPTILISRTVMRRGN